MAGGEGCEVFKYITPTKGNKNTLAQIAGRHNNYDSFAIHAVSGDMVKLPHYEKKVLFVISDGQPAGSGYGAEPAWNHCLEMCKESRRKGVEVYGIGISGAFNEETAEAIYGTGKFILLPNGNQLGGVLGAWITRICER